MSQVAFVFPGQGSQSVGMLSDYLTQFDVARECLSEASEILKLDLIELISNGPQEKLNQTQITQPVMLACDVALWRVFCDSSDKRPVVAAGHSLGEYAALVASGALTFSDAMTLVAKRAQFMQEAVPVGDGAMAAMIGGDEEHIGQLCASVAKDGAVCVPVNFNSPGQIVIAGNTSAVTRACEKAQSYGVKIAKQLPVSVPSHCELMQSAYDALLPLLKAVNFAEFAFPVIKNVDAKSYSSQEELATCLALQVVKPVRWTETVLAMVSDYGVTEIVECGPGKVLSGLNRRIDKSIKSVALSSVETMTDYTG